MCYVLGLYRWRTDIQPTQPVYIVYIWTHNICVVVVIVWFFALHICVRVDCTAKEKSGTHTHTYIFIIHTMQWNERWKSMPSSTGRQIIVQYELNINVSKIVCVRVCVCCVCWIPDGCTRATIQLLYIVVAHGLFFKSKEISASNIECHIPIQIDRGNGCCSQSTAQHGTSRQQRWQQH